MEVTMSKSRVLAAHIYRLNLKCSQCAWIHRSCYFSRGLRSCAFSKPSLSVAHSWRSRVPVCAQVRWTKTARKGKQNRSIEDVYEKKTQLEHILHVPDTYIGSVIPDTKGTWVVSDDGTCIVKKEVTYPPGLFKIFDEILVNAADNKMNDPKMTCIKIDIDQSKNMVRIWNDGRGIPVIKHTKYDMYIPTLIFGHLLTSSNYDNTLKRVTGGRNGFGAKLCNIFSDKFIVETSSKKQGLVFEQTWKNNMSVANEPVIKESTKDDYTCVTFYPDLKKFQETSMTDDLVSLFRKRAYDVAATTKGIKVILNGKTLQIDSFKDYVNMYVNDEVDADEPTQVVHGIINKRWEIAVTASGGSYKQTSFVNSLYTEKGGTHVKHVTDKLIQALSPIVEKKTKSTGNVSPTMIRNHLWVFVNCLVENPSFNSQIKETLTTKQSLFGSDCNISKAFIDQVVETGLVNHIAATSVHRRVKQVDRDNTTKSKKGMTQIPKLDDADKAGTVHSEKCTLILTEGDSAKATALAGIGVVGREHYGVFPLTGKLLNVRQSTMKEITENKNLQSLMKILGLKLSQKYTTPESLQQLRYGRIMIMADQDEDGSHIKGLIINFIHFIWPKLIQNGFIVEFRTPLIKVSKGKEILTFFNHQQYQNWKEETPNWPTWTIKYYKGLGTNTSKEAREYFRDMSNHMVMYKYAGQEDDHMISMMFGDDSERRKKWFIDLMKVKGTENEVPQVDTSAVTYSDFINREMLQFTMMSIDRSIPSMLDGLKVSQRKIIYTCIAKKYTQKEIKVLQLAASVAAFTGYHHGEISLIKAITLLAQDYVGSNNMNLLMPIGQFGTRLTGGKDAAASRYIFTKLSPLAMLVYNPKDLPLLDYSYFDEQQAEPVFFYPILPVALVNGVRGIATGWSTTILNYDVRDIVNNLHRMLQGDDPVSMIPSYRNFQGSIERKEDGKYRICGNIEVKKNQDIVITELPVGVWTQTYKEKVLVPFLNSGKIKSFSEEYTDTLVKFVVKMDKTKMAGKSKQDLLQYLKLETTAIPNMVLLDENGVLKRYENTQEILKDFFKVRWKMYEKRKQYLESYLEAERSYLDNRVRFVTEKIEEKLKIENQKIEEVTRILHELGYSTDPMEAWKAKNKDLQILQEEEIKEEKEDSSPSHEDFSYLLNMTLYSLTYENKEKLVRKLAVKENELQMLKDKSVNDMWTEDLNEFMALYEKEHTTEHTNR